MSINTRLQQLKFEMRAHVAKEPALHPFHRLIILWTQYKMRGHIDVRECRVERDRDLVIDGFQGSGNSFATRAFKYAQNDPVRIAHHLHSPAQIIKAVRLGIPTLVTIREPSGSVASLISRWEYVTIPQALRSYINFYRKISPYSKGFLVTPFEQTISNLSPVFDELNHRFETEFEIFEHTEANVDSVRNYTIGTPQLESERQRRKQQLLMSLEKDQHREQLAEAQKIYDYIVSTDVPV